MRAAACGRHCRRRRRSRRGSAPPGSPSRPPARQSAASCGFVWKHDLLGDLRLAPAPPILAPLLGQVQRPAQRQRPPLTDRVHRHRDLAVADLAQRARVLALHPRRVLAVLDDPGVVDDPGQQRRSRAPPAPRRRAPARPDPKASRPETAASTRTGPRLLQPKQRRLQALAAACSTKPRTYKSAFSRCRRMRQLRRHHLDERGQPLTHLGGGHLRSPKQLPPSPPSNDAGVKGKTRVRPSLWSSLGSGHVSDRCHCRADPGSVTVESRRLCDRVGGIRLRASVLAEEGARCAEGGWSGDVDWSRGDGCYGLSS